MSEQIEVLLEPPDASPTASASASCPTSSTPRPEAPPRSLLQRHVDPTTSRSSRRQSAPVRPRPSRSGSRRRPNRHDSSLQRVVVVGASAAGLAAADGLREAGFDGAITILGAERHHPFDRPTLSKGLLLDKGEPEMLELRSAERITENRLDLRLGHEAVGLDVDRRYVVTNYGEALPWDAVVLACGSRPRQLPGHGGPPLPVLRTPDDLRTLRQAAARHGAVSIMGQDSSDWRSPQASPRTASL